MRPFVHWTVGRWFLGIINLWVLSSYPGLSISPITSVIYSFYDVLSAETVGVFLFSYILFFLTGSSLMQFQIWRGKVVLLLSL